MMQGRIQRTVLERVEPRADTRLPTAWISENTPALPWTGGDWLTSEPGMSTIGGNAAVIVLLANNCKAAREELLEHAAAGARVYVLVGPEWGKGHTDSEVLQAPRVLVRRLAEVPASAIYSGAEEARLWIGSGWVLRLDPSQAHSLRQAFLRLFWHEATEEAWSGENQFDWREARERPFDVPMLPPSALVRMEPAHARLSGDARGALMHVSTGLPPDQAPRRLWFPAGPEHHDRLAKLAQAGVDVLWADRGLPDLQVNGSTGEVLLPGKRGRLRVRLTAQQASEVARVLEAQPTWRFEVNVRLGEAAHRAAQFWLPGEAAARGLEVEQVIEVPDVVANSLREAYLTEPAAVPAAQPLALAARYQWKVVPPRVPSGAEDDPLVGRWRKLDEEWSARLTRCRDALVAVQGDRGRIGQAFSRLISAVIGFEHTHSGLLDRVSTLEAQSPSAVGPSGAPALLAQLGDVEEAVRKLQDDQNEAERKAREEEDREKQKAAWQSRLQAANRDLPDRRSALTTAESELTAIKNELRGIEDSLKSADKDANKDITAKQRKLSDDLRRKTNEVSRLSGEIATLEQQAVERFEFRPPPAPTGRPAQPGGRFVPTGPSARPAASVPEEALPQVGSLRISKGQRYLVIDSWDLLDEGENAAKRLNAKLVAPENV